MSGVSRRSLLSHWAGIGLIGLGVLWESLFAPALAGWGFILVGFVGMLWGEQRWPVRTPLDWPLGLLAAMACVSLLVSASFETTRPQVAQLGASLAGFYGLVNWARSRKALVQGAAVLVALAAALALLAPVVVDWRQAVGPARPVPYRFFPLLVSDPVHPNIMASLLAVLFPLTLAWCLASDARESKRRRAGRRALLGSVAFSMAVVLLLTWSRGGAAAGLVGGLLVIWLSWPRQRALVATLALLGLGLGLFVLLKRHAPGVIEEVVNPSTWEFRKGVWLTALQIMNDFPITGIGMGMFNQLAAALYAFWETVNPGAHNLYLQVGLDLGLPGLIAYLAALLSALGMASAAARALGQRGQIELRALAVGGAAGLAALMVNGLVDVAAWGTRAAFVPWLLVGLIAALYRWTRADEPDRSPQPAA